MIRRLLLVVLCVVTAHAYFHSLTPIRPTSVWQTTTHQPSSEEDDYPDISQRKSEKCNPINPALTAPKTGQKAWDMCLKYQETLVYPCKKNVALTLAHQLSREDYCRWGASELIVGGTLAGRHEFPHMALLGYDVGDIYWACGGSLISDKFVLTAAHCVYDWKYGPVQYVYIGAFSRTEVAQNLHRKYTVKRTYQHPGYRPPGKYNDIALLELDTPVALNKNIVPACLPVGHHKDEAVMATGWGATAYGGHTSDKLMKVNLTKFTTEECKESFPPQPMHLQQGYSETTQMCYGDFNESKDTCHGDSGGPIQIKHEKIYCMYVVIGITSTGNGCGFVGEPAIYTRVARYVPWIESIMWP